ncbi:amidohydrolase [Bacillaceae bacterium Marseille-Q3522]|nr:amidohydrolase [Bacillaceae bacterium Marseille-Q3522]
MGLLWYGGTIYTFQEEGHTVEAILTDGGKIIALGNVNELEKTFHKQITKRKNLQGATMLPGFVDSHLHIVGHGEKLIHLDLSPFTSKKTVLKAIKEYAAFFPSGEWIIGDGWNENAWTDDSSPISQSELNAVVPDCPILLKRICHHAIAVNGKALEIAGITEMSPCPSGGIIEYDQNGKLTGVFKDQAQELILHIVPKVTKSYIKEALRKAIRHAHSLGLTGGHTEDLHYYGGYRQTYEAFEEVINEEDLLFRAHLLVHYEAMDDFIQSGGKYLQQSGLIEFGSMKIFADGALGARTAYLREPYSDDPNTKGVAIFSQKQLNALVKKAREYHVPVAIHAIGDMAFEMVLNAIERHPLTFPGRDRIIHALLVRKDLLDRAKKLPVVFDIQPSFLTSDYPWVIDRIGQDRLTYGYAWKTMLEEGIPCAGGSDAPIELLNPLYGIYCAITRKSAIDGDNTVYGEKEKLTTYEAVLLYTKGSAYAACLEKSRGMLKEGFDADFTILEEDIFQVSPEKIPNIQVSETVIGGVIVYGES